MKLPLRYFLILCIVLGAVAIPVGWRWYQTWKEAEIERLEKELSVAVREFISSFRIADDDSSGRLNESPRPTATTDRREKRVAAIAARLKKLTGKKQILPSPYYDAPTNYWPPPIKPVVQQRLDAILNGQQKLIGVRPDFDSFGKSQ